MAATIKIKNSSTASAVPTSSDLVQGELAVNVTDKRVFTENASGTVVELGTNPSTLTVAADATINGIKVGKGASSVSTNTAVGLQALNANTTGTANGSFGYAAMQLNTTGGANNAFGYLSLQQNTTGSNNTAIGNEALRYNTTASNNTAVGYQAGYTNTTGTNLVALGWKAGYTNNGNYNTFIGHEAGYSNTSGANNVFVGWEAGYYTTGSKNTFIGGGASNASGGSGVLVTTGSANTIIGNYNGNQGGLDFRTQSNFVVLSDGDGNWGYRWSNGAGTFQQNNSASWSTTSDARVKENIVSLASGLDKILALRPVEFDYKIFAQQHEVGFIAQEYQQVLPDQVTNEPPCSEEISALTNGEPLLGIQQNLTPYLVKAIQELKESLDSVKAEFDAYKEAHP